MKKIYINKAAAVSVFLSLMVLFLSGCHVKTHTVIKEDYCTDETSLVKYFNNLNIESAEYEMIYPSEYIGKVEIGSFGPTEPKYRGAIFLTKEEAQRLIEDYTWSESSNSIPELGKADSNVNLDDEWYESSDFNEDNFKLGTDEEFFFNGKDTIVFTFKTI